MITFELARLRGWNPRPPVVTTEEHIPLTDSLATPWEAYRERQQADTEGIRWAGPAAWPASAVCHWQKPAAAPNVAACHGRATRAAVTSAREAVTCGTCRLSRAWRTS